MATQENIAPAAQPIGNINKVSPALIDLADALTAKLAHAQAFAEMTYGGAGEAFREMNAALQDDYLCGLATMLRDAHQLACQITRAA